MANRPIEGDGIQYLFNTGLLFEINRRVLHPFGLALKVIASENENITFGGLVEGGKVWSTVFDDNVFKRGVDRYTEFRRKEIPNLIERKRALGYVIQGDQDCHDIVTEQLADAALWTPATTSQEARLQKALRDLHQVIESPLEEE